MPPSTSQKSKKKRGSPLLRLPPDVLRRILDYEGVVTNRNLSLSKALLPYTLRALFHWVELHNAISAGKFAASLVQQPDLVKHVHTMLADNAYQPYPATFSWSYAQSGRNEGNSRKLQRLLLAKKGDEVVEYNPKIFTTDLALLQDILAALPRLRRLFLGGEIFTVRLLRRTFLDTNPLSALRFLSTILIDEGDAHSEASELLSSVGSLPSLEVFRLRGDGIEGLPIDLLNVSGNAFASRTLQLKAVEQSGYIYLGPEARILFQAFAPTLVQLKIATITAYPRLLSDLALLPPSLVSLSIGIGELCGSDVEKKHPKLETDGSLPIHQPKLRHLHLHSGDILTPSTLDVLRNLPSLSCLFFGSHTNFTKPFLLDLIEKFDDGIFPSLDRLSVDLCDCKTKSAFPVSYSTKVVAAAQRAGLNISGSIKCKLAGCTAEHCQNWCTSGGSG